MKGALLLLVELVNIGLSLGGTLLGANDGEEVGVMDGELLG